MDADGLVHFLGRADSQIKSRGYRIELGEIETALERIDGLSECAVVGVDTGGFEGTAICCAYARVDGSGAGCAGPAVPPWPSSCRATCCRRAGCRLDALPKNVNGKIDRPALRERFSRDLTCPAGPSPSAERIGELVRDTLGVRRARPPTST